MGMMGAPPATTPEPAGANCPLGGVRIGSASSAAYVCNGASGAPGQDGTSPSVAVEPPGMNCPAGGLSVTSGTTKTFACNGLGGPPGDAGVSVRASPEAAGTNCRTGGVRFDAEGGTTYACNGDPATLYARTRIVRADGTAAANGAALRAAVANLSPPSAGRSFWRIVLEPGTYDLGTSTLSLANVQLVGAGREVTFISGAPAAGALLEFSDSGWLEGFTLTRLQGTSRGVVLRFAPPAQSSALQVRSVDVTASTGTPSQGTVTAYLEQTDGRLSVVDAFIGGFQRAPGLVSGVDRTQGSTSLHDVAILVGGEAGDVLGASLRGGSNSTAELRDTRVDLFLPPTTTAPIGLDTTAALTARNLGIVLRGIPTAAPTNIVGVRLTSPVGGFTPFVLDGLRVDLSNVTPDTTPRRALLATGPGTLEVRHPFFVGTMPSSSAQVSISPGFIGFGLVGGVVSPAGATRCVGLLNAAGTAVTCP
jgi:hypothetical protein